MLRLHNRWLGTPATSVNHDYSTRRDLIESRKLGFAAIGLIGTETSASCEDASTGTTSADRLNSVWSNGSLT
jgi:hypothetical protein